MFMIDCERLQAVELVSPCAVEAVVVDACLYKFSHYKRLLSIRGVVLLLCCELGRRMFWGAGAGSYKWQYILIAAFSSSVFISCCKILSSFLRRRHMQNFIKMFSIHISRSRNSFYTTPIKENLFQYNAQLVQLVVIMLWNKTDISYALVFHGIIGEARSTNSGNVIAKMFSEQTDNSFPF